MAGRNRAEIEGLKRVEHPHVVSLEARPATTEGKYGVRVGDLVTTAMRMSPRWLVVGEVRHGDAAVWLMRAQMSDHPGMSTIHADDPKSAVETLCLLAMIDNDPPVRYQATKTLIARSIDLFVQIGIDPWGVRRITRIGQVAPQLKAGEVWIDDLYLYRAEQSTREQPVWEEVGELTLLDSQLVVGAANHLSARLGVPDRDRLVAGGTHRSNRRHEVAGLRRHPLDGADPRVLVRVLEPAEPVLRDAPVHARDGRCRPLVLLRFRWSHARPLDPHGAPSARLREARDVHPRLERVAPGGERVLAGHFHTVRPARRKPNHRALTTGQLDPRRAVGFARGPGPRVSLLQGEDAPEPRGTRRGEYAEERAARSFRGTVLSECGGRRGPQYQRGGGAGGPYQEIRGKVARAPR